MELHQRLSARMRAASRSMTSGSWTASSTHTRPPACGRWWSLGFMPKDLAAVLPTGPRYQVHYPQTHCLRQRRTIRPRTMRNGGADACGDGAPGAAVWRQDGARMVLRGLERAGHRLLARHAGGTTGSCMTMRWRACARRCPARKVGGPATTGPGNAQRTSSWTGF